jgi:hypothetical protein
MNGLPEIPSLPLPAPPPPDWVMGDLPCRSCGYNLRTLSTEGICPECATPVRTSMRGELLRDADPNWLYMLLIGCRFVVGGMLATWLFAMRIRIFQFDAYINLVAVGLTVFGAWLLCIPDPCGLGEDKYGVLRLWTRALAVACFGLVLLRVFLPIGTEIYTMVRAAELIARLMMGVVLLWYLSRLGTRIQNFWNIGTVRWAMPIYGFLALAATVGWLGENASAFRFNPILRKLTGSAQFFSVLALYYALRTFSAAVRDEQSHAAARAGSPWRTAGASLYLAKQFFRRKEKDVSEKK